MRIVIDRQKVARRARLSHLLSLGGMFILLASVVLPLFRPQFIAFATPVMLAGMFIAMIGIYFANRWVKKPRPEDRLDDALKSLSDAHQLYHYPHLSGDHILLTPGGLVVLETVNLEGRFTYRDGRWKEKMTLGRALRWVVEEHLGEPARSALGEAAFLQRQLAGRFSDGVDIPVKAVVVFTHPASQVDLQDEPPVPVVKVEKLKKAVVEKGKRLRPEVYEGVERFLSGDE